MNTKTLIATAALVASLSFTAGAATVSDFTELSFAIANANEGDTITLDDKTFDVTAKIEITTAGLTIVGAGKGKTILDCGSTAEPARSNAVFYVHAPNVKISGLTIQNAADFEGNPAVYVSSGNNAMSGFEISDCEFVNCHGSHAGGIATSSGAAVGSSGIEARANYPIITGCDFKACGSHGNTSDSQGGAVWGSFWVENSTFDACTRKAWSVVMLHSSSVVSNCVFSNMGKAETEISNGLICMSQDLGMAHLLVEDCVFTSIGEGPLVGQAYSVIDRCIVSNCYATAASKYDAHIAAGDSISAITGISTCPWVNPRGVPECRDTLFVDNKLPIQLEGSDVYVNCTFVNNVGGLFCKNDAMTVALENCVFWGNSEWKCAGAHIDKGGYGITFSSSGLPTGMQIANCVFEHASENAGLMAAANVDTTGVSSNLSCRADAEGVKFNNYANGDFRPATNSVLVTNGVVLAWMSGVTDLAGRPRLSQNLVDIGCYQSEFGAEPEVEMIKLRIPAKEGLVVDTVTYTYKSGGGYVSGVAETGTDGKGKYWLVPKGATVNITWTQVGTGTDPDVVPAISIVADEKPADSGEHNVDENDIPDPVPDGGSTGGNGFDVDDDKVTIEVPMGQGKYGYKKAQYLEDLPSAPLLPLVSNEQAGRILRLEIERDPNMSSCFYQVIVEE